MIIYLPITIAVIAVVFLLVRIVLGYRGLTEDAIADLEYKRSQNMVDAEYGQAVYVRAYRRLHAPRGAEYVLAILACCAILTMPMLAAMNFAFEFTWRLGGQERTFEPGYLVWQFMLATGLIIGWALIAWFGSRHFYQNSPGSLDEELKKLNES